MKKMLQNFVIIIGNILFVIWQDFVIVWQNTPYVVETSQQQRIWMCCRSVRCILLHGFNGGR